MSFTFDIYHNGRKIVTPSEGFDFDELDEALKVGQHDLEAIVINKSLVTTFADVCVVIGKEHTVEAIIVYKPSFQYEVIDTAEGIRKYLDDNLRGVI